MNPEKLCRNCIHFQFLPYEVAPWKGQCQFRKKRMWSATAQPGGCEHYVDRYNEKVATLLQEIDEKGTWKMTKVDWDVAIDQGVY